MLISWPAAIKPSGQSWTLTTPVQRSRSAWTGREKRLLLGGARWSLSCTLPPMRLENYQAWQSFTGLLEGSLNTFEIYATPTVQTGPATATWPVFFQLINYVLYSEQFGTAPWGFGGTTSVTANTGTAPDGGTTVDTINTPTAGDGVAQTTGHTVTPSLAYTFSVWLAGTAGQTCTIKIDTSTGVGGTTSATVTLTATLTRYSVVHFMAPGATGFIQAYILRVGAQTATAIKAWGAMVQAGSVPSGYVKTTSATVASLSGFLVSGLTPSSTNMTEGQMLTANNRLYTAVAPIIADAGGVASVWVAPNLIAVPTGGQLVYVQRPFAVVTLSEAPSVAVDPGPIYTVAFTAEEAF